VQQAAYEELQGQLTAIEAGAVGPFTAPRYVSDVHPDGDATPYLQGAAIVVDAATGDVLAWVGGRDFDQSAFDRVALAQRQAGSTFKPFVYAAALEQGLSLSRQFASHSLRDALVQSNNEATLEVARTIGLDTVADLAARAGLRVDAKTPSTALGVAEVSPLRLAAAYTAFVNAGAMIKPRLIQRVEDEEGRILWQSSVERHHVLHPATAFLITDVLSDAVQRGTAAPARGLSGVPVAGKTGTTNDVKDAWFVGYTPEVVGAVWIGFDQPRTIVADASATELTAPVWGRLVDRLDRAAAASAWPVPSNVVQRRLDAVTGLMLEDGCDTSPTLARVEWFVIGTEPAAMTCREPLRDTAQRMPRRQPPLLF
jgi:penicillin-binding protein 1A